MYINQAFCIGIIIYKNLGNIYAFQPTQWSGFVNPTLGALMERVLLLVSGIRSTKASYSLVKGSLPDVLIHSDNQTELAHLQQFR